MRETSEHSLPGLALSLLAVANDWCRGCVILDNMAFLPFINTVDKTQLHTQNGNSRSH